MSIEAPVPERAGVGSAGAAAGAGWLAKLLEVALTEADLTPPQFRLLLLLDRSAERAKGVALRLDVSPPSVTALVDAAVQRGLVARAQEAADRRSIRHSLTPDGEAALEAGRVAVLAKLDGIASHLTATQARKAYEGLELWWSALQAAWAQDQ